MKKDLFDILVSASTKQFDFQEGSIESIENKTGILLPAIFGTPAIFIGLPVDIKFNPFFIIGFIPLIIAGIYGIKTFWCKSFSLPADLKSFYKENKKKNLNSIRLNYIDDCAKASFSNITKLKEKGFNFNISILFYSFTIILFTIGIIEGRWINMSDDNNQQVPNSQSSQINTPTNSQNTDNINNSGLLPDREATTVDMFKGHEEPDIKK
jgi:hypothetical protein